MVDTCGDSLRTRFTEMLDIRVPLLNAPMTPHAGGALARAVAEAGGLGMFGLDEHESADDIRAQIRIVRAGDALAFGIGLVAWMVARRPELVDLALEAAPRVVGYSFGDAAPYVERFHQAGIRVMTQVQDRKSARVAIDAGVDILVAQGAESGGHTGTVGTLPLLAMLLDMTDRPVLAAGGIYGGRGLAAVLAAGGAGAWIGTPFLLARESRTPEAARAAIVASDETQTIYTSVYDRAQATGWTSEHRGRALANPFARRWDGREDELLANEPELAKYFEAKRAHDYRTAHVYAGQSVGALETIRPAAEIVRDIETTALRCIANVGSFIARRPTHDEPDRNGMKRSARASKGDVSNESSITDARISYEKGELVEGHVASDPFAQFKGWLDEALATDGLIEPYAVTVASVAGDGQPSARVVLLRGYDERGFVFFTNYESRKGHELDGSGKASLLFYWGALERQIRIDGSVARIAADESDTYFAKRPRGHRLSAWASKQSSVVPDRAFLEAEMAEEDARFKDVEVPRPPYWGGYRVSPHAFEFWQGRRNRVHDRIAYVRDGAAWRIERLSP